MTIITTEIQKWKRNKIVWCILALTLLLGAFAIERACSISRSSPFMDSFGDLYTLAFKNLSSLFLPIVLGMFATTLFFDEHKNDTMKELLIIPAMCRNTLTKSVLNLSFLVTKAISKYSSTISRMAAFTTMLSGRTKQNEKARHFYE